MADLESWRKSALDLEGELSDEGITALAELLIAAARRRQASDEDSKSYRPAEAGDDRLEAG